MKNSMRKVMAVVMAIALVSVVSSCASTSSSSKKTVEAPPPAPKKTGFLHGFYQNLQPVAGGGDEQERWLKPGVDFSKYKKVILEHVVFYFDEDSESKAIDTSELGDLAQKCNLAFANAIKESYPIVTEPGPDVVRMRLAITDLKASNPAISTLTTITMVTPVGLGVGLLKKGATHSWSGSGATAAEAMVIDSETGQVIAAGKDRVTADFEDRYSKWGSVDEAFDFWGKRLKKFLDTARSQKP